jgi:hypothetical protein
MSRVLILLSALGLQLGEIGGYVCKGHFAGFPQLVSSAIQFSPAPGIRRVLA